MYGMGGRPVRTDPADGHIFELFAVEYEYAHGAGVLRMCRQLEGTDAGVREVVVGSKGQAGPGQT